MPDLLTHNNRLDAVREFLAEAEDPEKARDFLLGLMDPERDAEILDFLTSEPTDQ
jgi:hypothetical protein